MKRGWIKAVFLLLLTLMFCSCATAPKGEKSDKDSAKKSTKEITKESAEESAEDLYQKGMKKFDKGDFEDAVEAFKKAVDQDRKAYKAYYALGQAYEKLNKAKEAEEAYENAVKLKSDYLSAREALGLLCFHQKKFKEAEEHLKLARTLGSKVAEVYYAWGEIEQREHSCRTAIISYKQALKLDPDYLAARNGLKVAEEDCRQKRLPQPQQKPQPQQRLQQPQPR